MADASPARSASLEPNARQLADDLWVIDTLFQGSPGVIGSYLLTGSRGAALIDVGSAASAEQLLAGIRSTGTDPSTIRHLVLTHIHLDHAGAAGTLTKLLPGATVYVHQRGAKHLSDPTRLLESATRIYGARMHELWGEMVPVTEDRLRVVPDGVELYAGSRILRAVDTPGHASHHLAYYDAISGEVFTGDVGGVRLFGAAYVRPPTPPPDLDLEAWHTSIERLRQLAPRALYLAHFGQVTDVPEHLRALDTRLDAWGELMRAGLRAGEDDVALAARLAAAGDAELRASGPQTDDDMVGRYELATNYLMSAQGYRRYFAKVHPERLA